MASFTDSITQFNPYVSQLPVEAMVKVGMQKQAQYDQGVQKIQSQIDNVAGLDIAKNSDKQYLQSKLNQLGSRLTAVAAGDFSNQQLVNAVGGMATQVGKDENVQNAVASTVWYKKGIAEIDEARKKGKYSASNTWDFTSQADSWLNNEEVGQQFRGRYTPYTEDPNKKALEAIKGLHPNMKNIDIPYVIKNGQIDQSRLAEVMRTNKITGVTEGQIHDAISAVLNSNDYNQLSIDGRYKFRDVNSGRLQEIATDDYISQKKFAESQIMNLNNQRKMNVGDPNKTEEIEKRIKFYQDQIGDRQKGIKGQLDINLETNIEEAKNNPDGVKTRLYTDGFIKQFASAFKWSEEESKVVDSPYEKVRQWKADNAFRWTEFGQKKKMDELNYNLNVLKFEEDKKANELKRVELYGDQGLTDWTTLGNDASKAQDAAATYDSIIDNNAKTQENIKQNMMNKGRLSANEVETLIADWKKNPKEYKGDPAFIGELQRYAKLENLNQTLTQYSDKIMDAAAAKVMNSAEFKEVKALRNQTIKIPQVTQDKDGRNVTTYTELNGGELIKDIQAGKVSFREDKAPAGYIYMDYKDANGNARHISMNKLDLNRTVGGPQIKLISKYFKEYGNEVKKEYGNQIAPLVQEYVPRIKGVPGMKGEGVAPVVATNLSALITSADYQDIAADDNTNLATASSYLSTENLKNTKVFVHNYGGNNYEVWLKNEKSPNVIQKLKVPREKIDRIFGQGYTNNYSEDAMTLAIGRGNTNINANPYQSKLQTRFGDMPNIQKMDVTADLNQDLSNPDVYVPMINVKTKSGNYVTFPISGKNKKQRLGYEQGITQINALTDSSLITLLKENFPNFDFSTLDID